MSSTFAVRFSAAVATFLMAIVLAIGVSAGTFALHSADGDPGTTDTGTTDTTTPPPPPVTPDGHGWLD
jgi:hypothetical protein